MNKAIYNIRPKLLVLITDSTRGEKAENILKQMKLPVQYRSRGTGTASSDIMDYLGLDGNEKYIYISVFPKKVAEHVSSLLISELSLKKSGHGILFTLPLNGISGPVTQFLTEEMQDELDKKRESEMVFMAEKSKYSLLLTVADRGYSEEIMKTAKSSGAKGGTVSNARRLGLEDTLQLWGIRVQEEREIIAIVAEKENKLDIMRAIGKEHGMDSEAKGVILSLPIEDIYGM